MKTILVGTDYTPAGNRAVRYAAEMAFQYRANLVIVHATQLMMVSESPLDLRYILEEMEVSDRKKMQALQINLQKKYDHRLHVLTDVSTGFVADMIEKKSHQYKADLIVMGMPQVDFLSKKIFGSQSVRVISHAQIPVLIIPEKGRFRPIKKLVLAADGIPIKNKRGLEWIQQHRIDLMAELNYLHIQDELYPQMLGSYWKKLHDTFGTNAVDIHEIKAVPRHTAELIHHWSRKQKADWIIAIARERNLFWELFHESISKKLAYLSQLPVLLLNDKK
jgi:nucleotide-binding universal stress UspA family protein